MSNDAENHQVDTSDDSVPVFSSWNGWYTLVIIINLVVIITAWTFVKGL